MTEPLHLWVRAESRLDEQRVGITPAGVAAMINAGYRVTVEDSHQRIIPISDYQATGAEIAPEGSWPEAPKDAIIFGLKELPDDDTPLIHTHIMFGHAFKGQFAGQRLLKRFAQGGGTLLDLEYLVNSDGRRVAAFGYWAGFAGAGVSLLAWAAQQQGTVCPAIQAHPSVDSFITQIRSAMTTASADKPRAIVIGALGRVGTGAADLCERLGVETTRWDIEETQHGGPFPAIMEHDLFLNCILARPGTPVFVPRSVVDLPRSLSVIGDVACDPDSDYNPVPIYHRATTWAEPALRVTDTPPLDVVAIDNLPSLLPLESADDYAEQLLPWLRQLSGDEGGVWSRARATFAQHIAGLNG